MDAPQGLKVTADHKLTIGDLDLSGVPIAQVGPIVERLCSGGGGKGFETPLSIAWVPILFEGDVTDEANAVRIVNEGEVGRLLSPAVPPSVHLSLGSLSELKLDPEVMQRIMTGVTDATARQ